MKKEEKKQNKKPKKIRLQENNDWLNSKKSDKKQEWEKYKSK